MKKLTRLLVVALFAALIVGSVTSFKVAATNGTGACANCTKKATVDKCNGSAATVTLEPGVTEASGNCVATTAEARQMDTDSDPATPDVQVYCVITTYYVCQAGGVGGGTGGDQGCGLMNACGGQ